MQNQNFKNGGYSDTDDTICKISSLGQLEKLKFFSNFKAIEFGSIARTADLQKYNIYETAEKIRKFCTENNYDFYYATPEIIKERDLNRVYTDIKEIAVNLKAKILIVNNEDFLKKLSQDKEIKLTDIHIGSSVSTETVKSFHNKYSNINITGYDCSNLDYSEISAIPDFIKTKKYFIYGNKEIKTLLTCPLNDSADKNSGLYCSAPCTKGIYKFSEKTNFITDGFCRAHIFDEKISDNTKDIKKLKAAGITQFIYDLRFFC